MKQERKQANEVNSYEYLSIHLYERATKGGFEAEFKQLKEVLPYLNPVRKPDDKSNNRVISSNEEVIKLSNGVNQFERLTDLLKLVEQGDQKLVNYLLTDLIRLYRTREELRPSVVVITILILWLDLSQIYDELPPKQGYDERFADIYWYLLKRVNQTNLEETVDIKSELIIQIRNRFVGLVAV